MWIKVTGYCLNFGGGDEETLPLPSEVSDMRHDQTIAATLAEYWYRKHGQSSDDEVRIVLVREDGSREAFDVDIEVETTFHAHKVRAQEAHPLRPLAEDNERP